MSIRKSFKKKIECNKTKTEGISVKHHPMKLESLEPSLLLSGDPFKNFYGRTYVTNCSFIKYAE